MRHFVDDNTGYLQWLATEPAGFVLNTYRAPSAAYLVLHRATCKTISKLSGRASTFMGEYSKVCGAREDLERFARELGGAVKPCRLCVRDSALLSRDGGRFGGSSYIDDSVARSVVARAEELGLQTGKLRCLTDELNDNYGRGNTYAAHALLRTLLDHIPALLGCRDFQQLVNNYPWSRTDVGFARKLEAFRLQANDALHRPISRKADLLAVDDMPPRIWITRLLQECSSTTARAEIRNVGDSQPRTAGPTTANQRVLLSAHEKRQASRRQRAGNDWTGGRHDDVDAAPRPVPESSRSVRTARTVNNASKGEPIQPLDHNRKTIISGIRGSAFIAERQPDSTGQIYALRLFTGDVGGREAGDTFDAYHKAYPHPPCGRWTILATLADGDVTTGQIPPGVVKLSVNAIG